MFNNFFPQNSCRLRDDVEKKWCSQIDNKMRHMLFACQIRDVRMPTRTLVTFNTYCFLTETVFTRNHLSATYCTLYLVSRCRWSCGLKLRVCGFPVTGIPISNSAGRKDVGLL